MPAHNEADGVARQFVNWAVEDGYFSELIQRDILRLARNHFAPATGIEMPLDNVFLAALKKVAGVDYRASRTLYGPRHIYIGKSATYMIWAEIAERAASHHPHQDLQSSAVAAAARP